MTMTYLKKRLGQLVGVTIATAYSLYYVHTFTQWHFIDNVNLIFHEAGHVLFSFFGQFIQVAMGSGLQIIIPLSITFYFLLKRQVTSASVCLLWTGINLINVSVYAGDAILMQLPLLGGDNVIHDWNYILSSLNLLTATSGIATTLYGLGAATIGTGIALAYISIFKARLAA